MNVIIVSTKEEQEIVDRCLDAHADYLNGEISLEEFNKAPQGVWLGMRNDTGRKPLFWVCDNRNGECYYEEFETIDGAILYATDIRITTNKQHQWDVPGMLTRIGSLIDAKREWQCDTLKSLR